MFKNEHREKSVTKIVIATQTYKRPETVVRFLMSVSKSDLPVSGAVVVSQPSEVEMPEILKTARFPIVWLQKNQMMVGSARTISTNYAFEEMDADIVWQSDDDIIAIEDTSITPEMVSLCLYKGTGLISFTRQMGRSIKSDQIVPSIMVYVGNGIIISKNTWGAIGKEFSNDANDEADVSLRAYLTGKRNYRSRQCLVHHDQGGKGGGGIYAAIKDKKQAFTITEFDEEHRFYAGENPVIGKYRDAVDETITRLGDGKFTELTKRIHTRKRSRMKWIDDAHLVVFN